MMNRRNVLSAASLVAVWVALAAAPSLAQVPSDSLPQIPSVRRLDQPLTSLSLPGRAEAPTRLPLMPQDKSQQVFREAGLDSGIGLRRSWAAQQVNWSAPEYWHRPLYFEDAPLERYGQTVSPVLQPATSAVRFYSTIFVLPYKAALAAPWECTPNLGYCRPGAPTRPVRQALPWDTRAALIEAASITGVIWAVP